MGRATLQSMVTYNPWSVRPETSLTDVLRRFASLGVHHVPVVDDDRHLLGILAEADILRLRRGALAPAGWASAASLEETAEDAMCRQPVTISFGATPRDALQIMLNRGIHALPVIEDDRLVALITSRDFLREFSYGELPQSREPVSDILRPIVEPLDPDTRIDAALEAMRKARTSCLAVAQGVCPLGVIAERDIERAMVAQEAASEGSADSALPQSVLPLVRKAPSLRPGSRINEAAELMLQHDLPAITIVNQANRLLGVITEDDVLRFMRDGFAP